MLAPTDIKEGGVSNESHQSAHLSTQDNKIINSQTGQPIILKGIVTEYFRYRMNYGYPALYGGLEAEIEKIERLKRAGANINVIGLYLARLHEIKSNIDEMDEYINYARKNSIYIFLAPTGNAFIETVDIKSLRGNSEKFFKDLGSNDLAQLTELLAQRYGNYYNVIFQLTAEPNIPYAKWEVKQKELAAIVRKYTNNLIMVSTPYYTPYSYSSSWPVLPYDNIIYSTGGYISKNDHSFVERQLKQILGEENLIKNFPVMVAEFGGNYNSDFSSDRDLALFKNILTEINQANLSYAVFRLSSAFQSDGLAIFDTKGELTKKGEIFVNSFR